MNLTIRYAKHEDIERVNELRQMVHNLHAKARPDIFRQEFCDELRQDLYKIPEERQDFDIIVACSDNIICGFVVVQYVDKPQSLYQLARRFYQIHEFGVDVAFRRCGVATALMNFCNNEAKKKHFDRMELDVWAFNDGAIEFYEAVDFLPYRIYMERKVE